MSILTKFFGRAASEGAAFALGTAVGPTLGPAVRFLVNEANARFPEVPLGVTEIAQGVAQGQVNRDWATTEATFRGVNKERFNALVHIFDTGPGIEAAFDLWRRDLLDEAGFRRAAKRQALEPEWIDALVGAKQVLLTPAELANARQQMFIDVARQKEEAAKQGVNSDRAEIQFELAGLPPGPATGQDAANRNLIDRATFDRIIAEGHTKTKYTDLLWSLRHPVLSASVATTLRIKGWIEAPAQHAIGALSGYTAEQMDQLFLAAGRPAAPGQMWTAAARGIDGPAGVPMNEAQFLKGIKESDIRPEWGPMLWAIRYLYPSLFQLTRLVTAGQIDAATGADWAHKARYAPEVVAALRRSWEAGPASKGDPNVGKAETQLWSRLHSSYVANETTDAIVEADLDLLGVPQGVHARILNLWQHERSLIRRQLTPPQIKKAWVKAVTNPATGAPWTRDDALNALLELGYDEADSSTFLDE